MYSKNMTWKKNGFFVHFIQSQLKYSLQDCFICQTSGPDFVCEKKLTTLMMSILCNVSNVQMTKYRWVTEDTCTVSTCPTGHDHKTAEPAAVLSIQTLSHDVKRHSKEYPQTLIIDRYWFGWVNSLVSWPLWWNFISYMDYVPHIVPHNTSRTKATGLIIYSSNYWYFMEAQ